MRKGKLPSLLLASAALAMSTAAQAMGDEKPVAVYQRPPLPQSIEPEPKDPSLAVGLPGWKVETVLLYPQINTPSVVCALPDGRVPVNEHWLSNVGGKAPIDRIPCIHPDGRITLFADGLYGVFGQIFDGYRQTIIKTKDGDIQAGVVRSEAGDTIVLFDSSAQKAEIPKADVASRKASELSVMPEGLEQGLTPREFANLISYLESLRDPSKAVATPPAAAK